MPSLFRIADSSPHQFASRFAIPLAIGLPLTPHFIGSIFNIWYNYVNLQPLLSESQQMRFFNVVGIYNAIVYPSLIVLIGCWAASIHRTRGKLVRGQAVDADELHRSQRKVINLPWAMVVIGCVGWFMCIPVFLVALNTDDEPLHRHANIHLPISFVIAGLIAIGQSLFSSEICSLKLLYPVFFPTGGAAQVKGGYSLSLVGKGIVWAISAVACPVLSLLLLLVAPSETMAQTWFQWEFGFAVSGVAISFGIISALLIGRLVAEPVDRLRRAAHRVGEGDLDARVKICRADDFGPLIDEFNNMVSGLNEKEVIEATFGRHVGREAAKQIMAQQSELAGQQKIITVMFVDMRNFTARSSNLEPDAVVSMLNLFLSEMVEIVEQHHGMVNKFLGDGFMALFGAGQADTEHAQDAVRAGQKMLARMNHVNQRLGFSASEEALSIGVGIHTGPAVVGSIGSISRLEYTAIGDTVNIASRIESATKAAGYPLLFTESTRSRLDETINCRPLPAQRVKGKSEPIAVFTSECVSGLTEPIADN